MKPSNEVANNHNQGLIVTVAFAFGITIVLTVIVVISSLVIQSNSIHIGVAPTATLTPTNTLTPTPTFDPALNAPLPTNRIVAFYGIPGSPVDAAPAPTQDVLTKLQSVGQQYQAADPSHPVKLGLDIVVDVADGFAGPNGWYSHRVDPATIQSFVDFCQQNNMLLFLDLQFGRSKVQDEVNAVLPYLQKYSFVELAIDTEFHFPPDGPGVPDINTGSVDASDINWAIQQMHQVVQMYHVPRKVVMLHQFLPFVISNKTQITKDQLVDIVVHVDGFGQQQDKIADYTDYVTNELIQYGGFKLFFTLDAQPIMTPQQVISLDPSPLMITYQ